MKRAPGVTGSLPFFEGVIVDTGIVATAVATDAFLALPAELTLGSKRGG